MIPVIILAVLLSVAYAEVLPSKRYELTKEDHSKLSQLISDAGHTQKVTDVTADRYENGNIIINGIRCQFA